MEKNNVEAINQTIPVISNINEEYGKIAKEDDIKDEVKENDYKILKAMLGIQISSINGIENINKNEEENKVANNNELQMEKMEKKKIKIRKIIQKIIVKH